MLYDSITVIVQVYQERVYGVSVNCAKEAAKTGVRRFVEVSTAQVYNSDKVGGIVLADGALDVIMCRVLVTRRASWIHGQ